jgi:hypothetical protein
MLFYTMALIKAAFGIMLVWCSLQPAGSIVALGIITFIGLPLSFPQARHKNHRILLASAIRFSVWGLLGIMVES